MLRRARGTRFTAPSTAVLALALACSGAGGGGGAGGTGSGGAGAAGTGGAGAGQGAGGSGGGSTTGGGGGAGPPGGRGGAGGAGGGQGGATVPAGDAGIPDGGSINVTPTPGGPLLFYTDLDSAPPGAVVTLWGKGLGAAKGTVKVGTSTVAAGDVLSWTATRIEFRLAPGSAGSGVAVTTAGVTHSNALPLAVRPGRVLYVAKADGDNANDGLSDRTMGAGKGPWRDLRAVDAKAQPGDVIYVRAGTYDDPIDSAYGSFRAPRNGSVTMPIALVAYPGETPTIGSPGANRAVYLGDVIGWTVAKFRLAASNDIVHGGPGGRLRVVGNEMSGARSPFGTLAVRACTECKILGNHVYDSGQPGNKLAHLLYYEGFGAGSNVEIAWNRLHDQKGGRCIQVYGHERADRLSGLSIHDNVVYKCPYDCILVGSADPPGSPSWITDALVYGNLVYGCGDAAIRIDNGGVAARVLHNTLAASGIGIDIDAARSTIIQNNVFALPSASPALMVNGGGGLMMSNNGYQGRSAPSQDVQPILGDPLFVNAAAGDYTLGAASPLRGKGLRIVPALPLVPDDPAPDLGTFAVTLP